MSLSLSVYSDYVVLVIYKCRSEGADQLVRLKVVGNRILGMIQRAFVRVACVFLIVVIDGVKIAVEGFDFLKRQPLLVENLLSGEDGMGVELD